MVWVPRNRPAGIQATDAKPLRAGRTLEIRLLLAGGPCGPVVGAWILEPRYLASNPNFSTYAGQHA